jgi:hypothetical protein
VHGAVWPKASYRESHGKRPGIFPDVTPCSSASRRIIAIKRSSKSNRPWMSPITRPAAAQSVIMENAQTPNENTRLYGCRADGYTRRLCRPRPESRGVLDRLLSNPVSRRLCRPQRKSRGTIRSGHWHAVAVPRRAGNAAFFWHSSGAADGGSKL